MVGESDEGCSIQIHMVEVDGFLVNPPKEHRGSIAHPLGSDVSLVVMLKLRVFSPSAEPLKDLG
jgi:hypothetical protein